MSIPMTSEETREHNSVLRALDAGGLNKEHFDEWLEKSSFQFEDFERGWCILQGPHGRLEYTFKSGWVSFCYYVPNSTKRAVNIVISGRSSSGKQVPPNVLKEIAYDFSLDAVPERVAWVTAIQAQLDPRNVGPDTRIVEDLLGGDDDEFEKEFFLDQVFEQLQTWFKFAEPDSDDFRRFTTVADVVAYIKKSWQG